MSKICATCGKAPVVRHIVSHSHRHTKRRFDPQLQRVRIVVDGDPKNAYVCTAASIRPGHQAVPEVRRNAEAAPAPRTRPFRVKGFIFFRDGPEA